MALFWPVPHHHQAAGVSAADARHQKLVSVQAI
jgi:hypothetical protein